MIDSLTAAVLAGAYFLGAIPFGLVLARVFKGIDIREHGSKNIGATNVARTAGKPLGVLTLVLDAAKGAAPVLAAQHLELDLYFVVGAGLIAILGHVFPIYLRFRGGKGVATAAGVFAAITPIPMAIAFGVFALVAAPTRIVSAGSLAATLALVVATVFLDGRPVVIGLAGAVAVLVFWRHRGNVMRLLKRTENRV